MTNRVASDRKELMSDTELDLVSDGLFIRSDALAECVDLKFKNKYNRVYFYQFYRYSIILFKKLYTMPST